MKSLMQTVLRDARDKGTAFASLIPASRQLYFVYDGLGFSTVFYVNEERYTSLHNFNRGDFKRAEPTYAVYERLEKKRIGSVRHTEQQFLQAVKDTKLSGGFVVAVSDGNGAEAIAFVENENELKVKEILSSDEAAYDAVLSYVRENGGNKSMIVWTIPNDRGPMLRSRGMIRIIDILSVLTTMAINSPQLNMTIKVYDDLLPENSGTYLIKDAQCNKIEKGRIKPDLDVTISVLSEIIFSTAEIGSLFGFATQRPFISLMLD